MSTTVRGSSKGTNTTGSSDDILPPSHPIPSRVRLVEGTTEPFSMANHLEKFQKKLPAKKREPFRARGAPSSEEHSPADEPSRINATPAPKKIAPGHQSRRTEVEICPPKSKPPPRKITAVATPVLALSTPKPADVGVGPKLPDSTGTGRPNEARLITDESTEEESEDTNSNSEPFSLASHLEKVESKIPAKRRVSSKIKRLRVATPVPKNYLSDKSGHMSRRTGRLSSKLEIYPKIKLIEQSSSKHVSPRKVAPPALARSTPKSAEVGAEEPVSPANIPEFEDSIQLSDASPDMSDNITQQSDTSKPQKKGKQKQAKSTAKPDLTSNANMLTKAKIRDYLRSIGKKVSARELEVQHLVANKYIESFLDKLSATSGKVGGVFTFSQLEAALVKEGLISATKNSLALEFAAAFTPEQLSKMEGLLIPKRGESDTYFDSASDSE